MPASDHQHVHIHHIAAIGNKAQARPCPDLLMAATTVRGVEALAAESETEIWRRVGPSLLASEQNARHCSLHLRLHRPASLASLELWSSGADCSAQHSRESKSLTHSRSHSCTAVTYRDEQSLLSADNSVERKVNRARSARRLRQVGAMSWRAALLRAPASGRNRHALWDLESYRRRSLAAPPLPHPLQRPDPSHQIQLRTPINRQDIPGLV